jgi:Barrel-sandwich domain of CusB or HlyD membrane-fusion
MMPQANANVIATTLADFSLGGTEATCNHNEHADAPKLAEKASLIDWNRHRPSGTEQSLRDVLVDLSKRCSCELIFGENLSNAHASAIFSSHRSWTASQQASPLLKSSLIEASLAKQNLLIAAEGNSSTGVLENLRTDEGMEIAVAFSIPKADQPAESAASFLLLQPKVNPEHRAALADALPQLRMEFIPWVQHWQACRDARELRRWSSISRFWSTNRMRLFAISPALTLAALAIPVPYWPGRECVLEPAARRFVASPINGRVLKSLVRPGDIVSTGQAIGQMDDEQLRWELGTAETELQAAGKHQDSALANQEGGKLRLAQFERQKIALRIRELQSQLSRLELQSPIAGVVLQGDWYRSEGAPVNRGDVLFEIAPLDRMTVNLHLTTEDLSEIAVGEQVTVRIDNAIGQSWQGTISRIDPRAEVIHDSIRFVAEVELFNRDNYLRPGMKGSARIETGYKSIGWLLLHRPYVWLMKTIVW